MVSEAEEPEAADDANGCRTAASAAAVAFCTSARSCVRVRVTGIDDMSVMFCVDVVCVRMTCEERKRGRESAEKKKGRRRPWGGKG